MTHFSTTYGIVGIGVAAAIGFVFALGIISPSNKDGAGGIKESPQTEQSQIPNLSLQRQASPESPSSADQASERQSNFSAPYGQGATNLGTELMNQSDIHPTLTSVVALTSDQEYIFQITDGMQFKCSLPVFIRANLENQNEAAILNQTIIIDVRSKDGTSDESSATFNGDIASSSSTSIESYWQPARTGDYVVTVFSMTPEDLTSKVPIKPVAAIPVTVVQ